MGRKVHPLGFRLGINQDWLSRWFSERGYTDQVQEDIKLRAEVAKRLANASIARVLIERSAANQIEVTLFTAKPGIVIGKGGQAVEVLRKELEDSSGKKVKLNISEIKQPELDAYLVAESIAEQITRRVSHKRAMKQAVQRAMRLGAKGIRIKCSGRLAGAEMARVVQERDGRVPLHTLRADIDYGQVHAHTTYGRVGVKVWIYKGDVIPGREPEEIGGGAAEAGRQGGDRRDRRDRRNDGGQQGDGGQQQGQPRQQGGQGGQRQGGDFNRGPRPQGQGQQGGQRQGDFNRGPRPQGQGGQPRPQQPQGQPQQQPAPQAQPAASAPAPVAEEAPAVIAPVVAPEAVATPVVETPEVVTAPVVEAPEQEAAAPVETTPEPVAEAAAPAEVEAPAATEAEAPAETEAPAAEAPAAEENDDEGGILETVQHVAANVVDTVGEGLSNLREGVAGIFNRGESEDEGEQPEAETTAAQPEAEAASGDEAASATAEETEEEK